jgi:hypothetical protein
VVTVTRGDSLWKLAERYLGDGNRWREIWDLNKGTADKPSLIFPGVTVVLPADAAGRGPGSAVPMGGDAERMTTGRRLGRFVASHAAGLAMAAAVVVLVLASAVTAEPDSKVVAAAPPSTTSTHPTPPERRIPGGVVTTSADPITVPDVVGQAAGAATDTLRLAAFAFTIDPVPSASAPAGTVVSQVPPGGALAPPGTSIALTVSSGPPSTPLPQRGTWATEPRSGRSPSSKRRYSPSSPQPRRLPLSRPAS